MDLEQKIDDVLENLDERLELAMPEIRRQIKVYEEKLAAGTLSKSPKIGPQFNR